MEGAGPDDSSSADPADSAVDAAAATAVLWEAAANAMAWKASIRDHVARRERIGAWAAMAKADDALGRMAEACGRVVDGQGCLDTEALGRAAAAMREAAEMWSRTSKALARSTRLHRMAGAGLKRASRAYGRAADPGHAAEALDRAAKMHAHARASAGLAARVRRDARNIARDVGMVEATAAKWSSAGGGRVEGGEGAMSSIVAEMRELARQERTVSNGSEERLEKAERAAGAIRKSSAKAAMRSTASAAMVMAKCGDGGGPDVQGAAEAWMKAMAAANRADLGRE